eukprot:10871186-Alexandrium_andersonii.AAC.1
MLRQAGPLPTEQSASQGFTMPCCRSAGRGTTMQGEARGSRGSGWVLDWGSASLGSTTRAEAGRLGDSLQ